MPIRQFDDGSVTGGHKSAKNGRAYTFVARWTEGTRATWEAKVYREGELRGTLTGVVEGNRLTGRDLAQLVGDVLVASAIDDGVGIDD